MRTGGLLARLAVTKAWFLYRLHRVWKFHLGVSLSTVVPLSDKTSMCCTIYQLAGMDDHQRLEGDLFMKIWLSLGWYMGWYIRLQERRDRRRAA